MSHALFCSAHSVPPSWFGLGLVSRITLLIAGRGICATAIIIRGIYARQLDFQLVFSYYTPSNYIFTSRHLNFLKQFLIVLVSEQHFYIIIWLYYRIVESKERNNSRTLIIFLMIFIDFFFSNISVKNKAHFTFWYWNILVFQLTHIFPFPSRAFWNKR